MDPHDNNSKIGRKRKVKMILRFIAFLAGVFLLLFFIISLSILLNYLFMDWQLSRMLEYQQMQRVYRPEMNI